MSYSTKQLRGLLASSKPLVIPGAYDPLSARVIEAAGFPAVYLGGYATGAQSCITEPLMSITEQIDAAAKVAGNVSIPVLVDGHTGGGNLAHLARTVRTFERVGVAGIHIEDQVYPKSLGYHHGVKEIVPLEDAVKAIKVANISRSDPDFLIIARTDAWGAEGGGMDETVRRMEAFAAAGAEALVCNVSDPEDAAIVRRAVPEVPMVWFAGVGGSGGMKELTDSDGRARPTPELSIEDIAELGFDIIIYPVATVVAAVGAVSTLMARLRTERVCDFEGFAEANSLLRRLIHLDKLWDVERDSAELAESSRGNGIRLS
jgi:2-methylisocitrate lyase-like PEP mutase family enzyme